MSSIYRDSPDHSIDSERSSHGVPTDSLTRLDPGNVALDVDQQSLLLNLSLMEQRCKERAALQIGLPASDPKVSTLVIL